MVLAFADVLDGEPQRLCQLLRVLLDAGILVACRHRDVRGGDFPAAGVEEQCAARVSALVQREQEPVGGLAALSASTGETAVSPIPSSG